MRKFHLVPAASKTSLVSIDNLSNIISSLISAILRSLCVFSITLAASATLIELHKWVPASMIEPYSASIHQMTRGSTSVTFIILVAHEKCHQDLYVQDHNHKK